MTRIPQCNRTGHQKTQQDIFYVGDNVCMSNSEMVEDRVVNYQMMVVSIKPDVVHRGSVETRRLLGASGLLAWLMDEHSGKHHLNSQ